MYTSFTSNVNTVYKEIISGYTMIVLCSKKSYHHGDLRESLLSAAEEQLEEEGPAGLSLRKLGRALGVSPGAPYRHFEDKEALLTALATIGFQRLRETMLAEQDGATDPQDELRRGGIGYLKFAWAHPGLFRLVFGWMPAGEAPERAESGDLAFANLAGILEQCARDGLLAKGPMDAGLLAWSAVHGAAFLMIDDGLKLCSMAPDPVAIGNQLHDALWAGIAAKK